MSDTYRQRFEQAVIQADTQTKSRPRGWLVLLDYLFYLLVAIAVIGILYYFFSFNRLLLLYLPVFLQGTLVTLVISLISVVFATLFGFLGALGRLSSFSLLRSLATIYVEVIRGTPVLVQLLLWYYGIGFVLANAGFDPYGAVYQLATGLQSNSLVPDAFNGYFYGIVGLSFNYGAYLTEVFRTGIESVEKGQAEAALSLGLDSRQVMRRVILPQAIRITIPPFTNYFITLIQDSALLSILSVVELEHTTFGLALPQIHANDKLFVFIFGALFYLILCYPLALLSRRLEARLATAY